MGNKGKIADIRARLSAAYVTDADDQGSNVTTLTTELPAALRMLEALLFAASEPLDEATLRDRLPTDIELMPLLAELKKHYDGRGVQLVALGGRWQLRTAPDLAFLMARERIEPKKLSRAATETLAIIAYHQPVTRMEIEEIRGVSINRGTLDVLIEAGWVRLRGRRRTPGRPVCYGTSQSFLEHFGLENVKDLPGLEELKAAGLLSARVPTGFSMPVPDDADDSELDPLEDGDEGADMADASEEPESAA
jgi:segregation and condensation protein B